jgi:nucleoside-diphosphate-sugar epimerase
MDDGRPTIVLDAALARWKCPRGYVENVAAAIALACLDEEAAGKAYNVAEAMALSEADWVRTIAAVVGWRGEIVMVPRGRIPVPYDTDQDLDTDTTRITEELGFAELVPPEEALARTVAWERANPAGEAPGLGMVDNAAEDAILAEIRG